MKIKYSKVISPPDVELFTVDEAKSFLKVDGTDEDDLIELFIQACREDVENYTNRSLITQTMEMKLDSFPCKSVLELTNGLLIPDTLEIKYQDDNDVEQPLADSEYWIDSHSDIPRIVCKDGWPSTKVRPNAVTITYDAGYGDTADDVPGALRAAAKLILGHLYENRQNVVVAGSSTAVEIPYGARALMNPYRIFQDVAE